MIAVDVRITWHPRDGLVTGDLLHGGKVDAGLDQSGDLYASDGPLNPKYLSEYITGRVIGIFLAKDDPRIALPSAPTPRRGGGGPT